MIFNKILIFHLFFYLQKYLEPSPWLQTNFPFKAFQHKLATDTAGPEGEYLLLLLFQLRIKRLFSK
jgi:hypothetical protein